MSQTVKKLVFAAVSSAICLVSFQNCSKMSFSGLAVDSASAPTEQLSVPEIKNQTDVDVLVPETLPPSIAQSPYEDENYPGNNAFTAISSGAFLLACGKTIHNITSIGRDATVVLVNSSLSQITSVEGKLLLVNSRAARPTGGSQNIETVVSAETKALWEARCLAYQVAELKPDAPSVHMNTISSGNSISKVASSYSFTVIGAGVELVDLHTRYFQATSIGVGATIKVKTKAFGFTSISEDSIVELY